MIRVFIDGPIAGDVRTDYPEHLGRVIKIPVPERVTTCYCEDDYPSEHRIGPEIVEYRALTYTSGLAIMSCAKNLTPETLLLLMKQWVRSDLNLPVWKRDCRDARAFI